MNGKLLFLFVFVAISSWAAPRNSTLHDGDLNRTEIRHGNEMPSSLDDDSLHQFDVLKISAELGFDIANSQLWGDVTIDLRADEIALNRIDLRFSSALEIDSIWSELIPVDSFAVEGDDSLQIYLQTFLQVGDSATLHIVYHGHPESIDGWGGIFFYPESGWRPPVVYTMGDGLDLDPPPSNYSWLPSFADPTDKVLWETWITVADDLVAVSGGVRIDSVQHDSTITWHYRLDQPVSTYLLFISVSEYEIMVQREANPIIENFVYPNRVTEAETHFSNVPVVLDGFAELFGPYPFDRFGFNMVRDGDMEHATSVSHYDGYVGANHTYDWLLFHEMSHMWWGDWVTLGDWRDLWLNEGFASYCEALAMEILGGSDAYHDYMNHSLLPTARGAANFTVYDPTDYWSSVVYEKGGCVLHMLRWVMGEDAFFQALREYGQEHAFGNAVTADFQAKCEEHYGESLQWFFDQWVYEGTGYPRYHVHGDLSDVLDIRITQEQTTGTYFQMPLEINYYNGGELQRTDTVWTEANAESYFESVSDADSIWIDPNQWILRTVTYYPFTPVDERPDGLPEEFAVGSAYPNPFNSSTTIKFDLPAQSPVALTVYNLQGQIVNRKMLGSMSPGTHEIQWDGNEFASGIYLFSLKANNQVKTAKAVLLK
jgi:aminopeptidase N